MILNKALIINEADLDTIAGIEWIRSEGNRYISYSKKFNVAVIPVYGLLTKRSEFFSDYYGTTSYEEIRNAITEALNDDAIKSILLEIDTPGGEVSGLFDLVDFIIESRSKKPIFAIADDNAFSAGYAIASACEKVFVTRTSGVGSIGVIATHVDISESDKKNGIKYTTIFSGNKKNNLSPHAPLSGEAIIDIQSEVDRLYNMFIAYVSRNRKMSSEAVINTQASTYFGENAVSVGLADTVTSFVDCIVLIGGIGMNQEDNNDERANYKAEVLEISKLCKLSRREDKLAEFIDLGLSVDEVKEKLLASMSQQEEIQSAVYHKHSEEAENPVIAIARSRIN